MKLKTLFFSFWERESICVFLLILLLHFFSYAPVVRNFIKTPPDRYYWGSAEYPIDQMGNLTNIREGYLGHWLRFPKVTSTIEGRPSFIKLESILIGQIARVSHIDLLVMYYLTRIIISLTTLIFIYFLIRNIYVTKIERFTAFLFVLFAASFTLPFGWSKKIITDLPLDVGVFSRLTNSSHHYLLGILFSLLSLFYLAKTVDSERKIIYFITAAIFGMLTSLVYSPSAVLIIFSLPVFWLILLFRKYIVSGKTAVNKRQLVKVFIYILVYVLITAIPIIYYRYISQFWEFNMLTKIEKNVPFNPLPWHYFYIVGIIYFLSAVAIPYVLKKGSTLSLMFLPWLVVHPIAIYLLAPLIDINKTRFFMTAYFVIFAILAVSGINSLVEVIKRLGKVKNIRIYTFVTIIVISLVSGKETYKISSDSLHVCFCLAENFSYGYPKKEVMETVFWLRDYSREDDIVLSGFYTGMLIPAFAGNKVYTSWWHRLLGPPNLGETYQAALRFYSGSMRDEEARLFLKNYKITYVFFGDNERWEWAKGEELHYPFLKVTKHSGKTLVYRVEL